MHLAWSAFLTLTSLSSSSASGIPHSYHATNLSQAAPSPRTRRTSPPSPRPYLPKASRSCLRDIISFKKIPGRLTFMRIWRAFMFGMNAVIIGYGIRDLSRGKNLIEKELGKQLPRNKCCTNFCCLGCGARMTGPTLHTADAGQAYEITSPDRLERAFRIIYWTIQIRTRMEDPTISCMHTPKAKA